MLAVNHLKRQGLNFVGGVDGLAVSISAGGARSWILRAGIGGKRCDIGLGPYPEIPLAKARDMATAYRQQIRAGINPIATKQEAKAALRLAQTNFLTFQQAAEQYIAAHESSWKNAKHTPLPI